MELSVQQLIEAIGISVSEAQQTIENHSMGRFFGFFNSNSDSGMLKAGAVGGSLSPKTIKMQLPDQKDLSKTAEAEIPIPALVHHRQVSLDKVTVNIKTRLRTDDNNNVKADMNAPIQNSGTSPEEQNGEAYGEINLVFNVSDSAEGLSRVVQNMTKTI